jgi:hypothetical protein
MPKTNPVIDDENEAEIDVAEPSAEQLRLYTEGTDPSLPTWDHARTVAELAQRFQVSTRTIGTWRESGAPMDKTGDFYGVFNLMQWRRSQPQVPQWLIDRSPLDEDLRTLYRTLYQRIPTAAAHARRMFVARLAERGVPAEVVAVAADEFTYAIVAHFEQFRLDDSAVTEYIENL